MNITIKEIELLELGKEYSNGNMISEDCKITYDIKEMYVWQGYDMNPSFIIGEPDSIELKYNKLITNITLYDSVPKGKSFIKNYQEWMESDSKPKKEDLIDFGWSIKVLNRNEDNEVCECKITSINLTVKK